MKYQLLRYKNKNFNIHTKKQFRETYNIRNNMLNIQLWELI